MSVASVRADSAAAPERLATADASGSLAPLSWSPDGRSLAVNVLQPSGRRDISVLDVDRPKSGLAPLLQSEADEINGSFSPDGKWFVYASDETGRYEVYVQPYPFSGQKLPVSEAGGMNPFWHPGGRELFYISGPDKDGRLWLMAMSFTAQPRAAVGKAGRLFEAKFRPGRVGNYITIIPHGGRFLIQRPLSSQPSAPVTVINLVDHWFTELTTKVPPK